jgi:hypothetical protein
MSALGQKQTMSALGQKQTSEYVRAMSALPPKADVRAPVMWVTYKLLASL